eukprot:TRINITY_DN3643_c0_g1_i1.p1 TRINITY_DN3643_c0_g1~~TRINITY_DN3643_c0_g1_i1.p1  ORF type:complete len:297 (-),score=48.33 TRINITY_DN3643_c0_g1_i1:99-950(-)
MCIRDRAYNAQKKYEEALANYQKAEEIDSQAGVQDIDLAIIYNNLGMVHSSLMNYEKAKDSFKKSHEIASKLSPLPVTMVAQIQRNLGTAYNNIGDRSGAVMCYREAENIEVKSVPDISDARKYNLMGLAYANERKFADAYQSYAQALTMLPEDHEFKGVIYENFGSTYAQADDLAFAKEYYLRSISIKEKTAEIHPSLATTYNNLGLVYLQAKEYINATTYFEKAEQIYETILGPKNGFIAVTYRNLEYVYRILGDKSKEAAYNRKADGIMNSSKADEIMKK